MKPKKLLIPRLTDESLRLETTGFRGINQKSHIWQKHYCISSQSYSVQLKKRQKTEKKPVIVKEITSILAKSDQEVVMIASRQIPEEYLSTLSQIDIVVRPF